MHSSENMKSFLKILLIWLLIVIILVGMADFLYMKRIHDQDYGTIGTKRNDSATIYNVPERIEICNFGNSHSFYALNYEFIPDKVCFSFALPDQSLRDDLQILKTYRDNIMPGATVLISISYTSLMGPAEDDLSPMYKRYYRFLPKENIIGYDPWTDIYTRFLPAMAADNIESFGEIMLNINDHADMWSLVTNAEEAKDHGYRRYSGHVVPSRDAAGNRRYRENELEHLYEMIDMCREIDAVPVLFTVPFLHEYTDPISEEDPYFYDDFFDMMNKICAEKSVTYLDYSKDKRFTEEYDLFINTDHMNRSGALFFTNILLSDACAI